MIKTSTLIKYCNSLLHTNEISDYCPNGLQVQGGDNTVKIATAVTASLHVIEKAVALGVDVLLVHHGYFWKNEALPITNLKYERIKKLIKNDIGLVAYHLPLDMHNTLGNNIQLAIKLGISDADSDKKGANKGLFWQGVFEKGIAADELSALIENKLNRKPLVINGENKTIKKVAWCTGGAQNMIVDAIEAGCDAFISGEISENTYHIANEANIVYFAAGHHATERYGIMALGDYVANKFNLEHVFIDENNPV